MIILPTSDHQLTMTFPQFTDQGECQTYVRELFADHAYAMLAPHDQHHHEFATFATLLGCLPALPADCTFGDQLIQLEVIPHYYHDKPQWDLLIDVNHHGYNQSFIINHQELADALWHVQTKSSHRV